MTEIPEAMAAEFDTVASWTATAVEKLGRDHALPAACRGSGSPAVLAWLCEGLRLRPGTSLLDVGAGVGGPAAFAQQRYGAAPVLTDPMPAAVRASRRLFGLPALVADGQDLPFRDGVFDCAWALGVLCTTEEKSALLSEVRRVVRPGGGLGLLVLVRTVETLPDQPEGNSFPSREEVLRLVATAGFQLLDEADAADFDDPPAAWQAHAEAVEALVADVHRGEDAWQTAQAQSGVIGGLLQQGLLRTVVMHASCV